MPKPRTLGVATLFLLITLFCAPPSGRTQDTPTPSGIVKLEAEAEQGSANAQFLLGTLYENGRGGVLQDYEQAARWYRKAAEQDHADAQFLLGTLYAEGRGVPQDQKQTRFWYTRAATNGYTDAEFRLGALYENGGDGAQQDYKLAADWYKKAAERGFDLAQHKLGIFYKNGYGVLQNYVLAHMWLNLAASGEDFLGAASLRDSLAKSMTPEQIAEAQRLAHEWKPKSRDDQ